MPLASPSPLELAVAALRRGGLVAFPTETVYGLGASARDATALTRLYAVKGRPSSHPVIVHLARRAALRDWATEVPLSAERLAEAFWPGPLTLLLQRRADVPAAVSGGLSTVGLRVPAAPLALELLEAFGDGVAAPSANRFGRVSPTTAAHVAADLGADVDVILDGGPCAVGVESTIVDLSGPTARLLRPGAITLEMLESVLGTPVWSDNDADGAAPGRLPSHYAPAARVELVDTESLTGRFHAWTADHAVLAGAELQTPSHVLRLAAPSDAEAWARELYPALRRADELGVARLFVVPPQGPGLAAAVRDRLMRAAGPR